MAESKIPDLRMFVAKKSFRWAANTTVFIHIGQVFCLTSHKFLPVPEDFLGRLSWWDDTWDEFYMDYGPLRASF